MGITSSTALWYASRATGVVALVLLTAVVLMGILVSRRGQLPGLPRFATTSLHRSLSLLAVAFIVVHVLTAIADPYVTISIAAIVIPFASPYKPLWLGLGAISLDIIIALVGTSLVRGRIGRRTWRAVHWLAYACWPLALVHGIGSATDLRTGWLLWLTVGCCVAVLAAVCWRLLGAVKTPGPAERPAQVLAMAENATGSLPGSGAVGPGNASGNGRASGNGSAGRNRSAGGNGSASENGSADSPGTASAAGSGDGRSLTGAGTR